MSQKACTKVRDSDLKTPTRGFRSGRGYVGRRDDPSKRADPDLCREEVGHARASSSRYERAPPDTPGITGAVNVRFPVCPERRQNIYLKQF